MRPSRMMVIAAMFPFAVGAAPTSELSGKDQEYLRDRARMLMVDIQAGQLASKKANTDQVRAFAYRLVNDHQQSLENLRKVAANRKVELPAAPSERDLQSVTRLTGLTGAEFDEEYIKRAIREHKIGTKADRKRRYGTKDPEMRTLAAASHEREDIHLALANRALANVPVNR